MKKNVFRAVEPTFTRSHKVAEIIAIGGVFFDGILSAAAHIHFIVLRLRHEGYQQEARQNDLLDRRTFFHAPKVGSCEQPTAMIPSGLSQEVLNDIQHTFHMLRNQQTFSLGHTRCDVKCFLSDGPYGIEP